MSMRNRRLMMTAAALAAVGVIVGGCGQERAAPASVSSSEGNAATTLARKGGERLVYLAKPTRFASVNAASLQRTIAVMARRAALLHVRDVDIRRSGNQLIVTLPDVSNADQAQQQLGTMAVLGFYDWETSVLGPDGKPDPTNLDVTGGSSAGQPGAGTQTFYEAVTRASKSKPTNEPDDTTTGLFYGVDDKAKSVLCGPQGSGADAREACLDAGKKSTSIVKVPRGYLIVQAEADEADKAAQATASDAYYTLKDDPALLGRDIKDPQQNIDNGPGGSGQPDVTFSFTDAGRKKWQKTTRAIARHGQAALLPGVDPRSVANHFAIVLDSKLISVPYIDPQQSPDGIDGSNGSQILGGFTIKSAQRLANLLESGPLPLALELRAMSHIKPKAG
jgi:SecD/SecF fusion protein